MFHIINSLWKLMFPFHISDYFLALLQEELTEKKDMIFIAWVFFLFKTEMPV